MRTLHSSASGLASSHSNQDQHAGAGFSQVDLLTVIGVLVLLGLLLTPALARTRVTDQAFQCRNNLRQLLNTWRMYAEDNSDKVPSAWAYAGEWWPAPDMQKPVNPITDGGADRPGNWNPDITIKVSPLWPYCGNNLDIWRCPGDAIYPCIVTNGPLQGRLPRVRSYTMSAWFNGADATAFGGSGFTVYTKVGDCLKPGPAMTFVFAHERVDSINDGELLLGMYGYPGQPSSWRLVDLPTSLHDGACGFSFVDGHSEMHSWQDVLLTIPFGHGPFVNAPNSKDAYWLMDHSTRKP
jgi:prepilin-type processing-associated H-X9-DG protein